MVGDQRQEVIPETRSSQARSLLVASVRKTDESTGEPPRVILATTVPTASERIRSVSSGRSIRLFMIIGNSTAWPFPALSFGSCFMISVVMSIRSGKRTETLSVWGNGVPTDRRFSVRKGTEFQLGLDEIEPGEVDRETAGAVAERKDPGYERTRRA